MEAINKSKAIGYQVTLFFHTHLNSVNKIENPSKLRAFLDSSNQQIVGVINTLQDVGIQTIRLNINETLASNCDFVCTENMQTGEERFFSVPAFGYKMLAEDVCELTIVFDAFLSAGGIKVFTDENKVTGITLGTSRNWEILDGWTERCTTKDDTWHGYTDEDPLVTPGQTMYMESVWWDPTEDASQKKDSDSKVDSDGHDHLYTNGDSVQLIETTADLALMAIMPMDVITIPEKDLWDKLTTLTDTDASFEYAPQVIQSDLRTVVKLISNPSGERAADQETLSYSKVHPETRYYMYNNEYATTTEPDTVNGGPSKSSTKQATFNNLETINRGIANLHKLGVENAVLNSWEIPKGFLTGANGTFGASNFKYKMVSLKDLDATGKFSHILSGSELSKGQTATDQQISAINSASKILIASLNNSKVIGDKQDINKNNYSTAIYYEGIHNKRCFYGKYNEIGMISCSGESVIYKPEELFFLSPKMVLEIYCICDPRPHGRPYFRFKWVNGDDNFFWNFIGGIEWANRTLRYEGASGSVLNTMNTRNSIALNEASYDASQGEKAFGMIGNIASTVSGGIGAISKAAALSKNASIKAAAQQTLQLSKAESKFNISTQSLLNTSNRAQKFGTNIDTQREYDNALEKWYSSMDNYQALRNYDNAMSQQTPVPNTTVSNTIMGGIGNIAGGAISMYNASKVQEAEIANELRGLYISNNVYVPTVQFPYNANYLRDVKHNGIMLYQYHYTADDMKRIDKLLTMYGYKVTKALEPDDFARRKHFDFIQCSGISIAGNLPKWWSELLAEELENGIRIWHDELPTSKAYNDNYETYTGVSLEYYYE